MLRNVAKGFIGESGDGAPYRREIAQSGQQEAQLLTLTWYTPLFRMDAIANQRKYNKGYSAGYPQYQRKAPKEITCKAYSKYGLSKIRQKLSQELLAFFNIGIHNISITYRHGLSSVIVSH